MSKHRQNPEKKPLTVPRRIAYGVGGAAVVCAGTFFGAALTGDGLVRLVQNEFDAPQTFGEPLQHFARNVLPDEPLDKLDAFNEQWAASAIEIGLGSLAMIAAEKSVSFVRRSITAPRPDAAPQQTPAVGPPQE